MLLGAAIKQGLKLSLRVPRRISSPAQLQRRELKKLMTKAAQTSFGKHYRFDELLKERDIPVMFREKIPLHTYNTMFEYWWNRCLNEEENVCWPGRVKYFALSSGTSESASKHIPITREMVKALRKATVRHMLTLSRYDLPATFFEKGILWLGGSTQLQRQGGYYEGDVSGISARRVPVWFQRYYKPGKKISKEKDWDVKLDEIVKQADKWDIGLITGVPSWIQLLMEKVIDHYHLKTIHDIWPNLHVYAHGGVSFEPYRKSFEKFFAHPVHFIEMYPASEGFIAFQTRPGVRHMKLILNNGIYYEFIPFDENNFDGNGELMPDAKALFIDEVEEGKDYALVMSTCAGAWRYLIGDTIRFTSVKKAEIIISGRTKHFLSLVGEHLSVDNMNRAVEMLCSEFRVEIPEFTVSGIKDHDLFSHQWYLGVKGGNIDRKQASEFLDRKLCELNDDYAVERKSALKNLFVEFIHPDRFYQFMQLKGRMGGQNKFPRVMKPAQHEEWRSFLQGNTVS
jgi:hypothetical protein